MNHKNVRLLVAGLLTSVLISNSARAGYDPTIGRWLSRDPIGEDGGVNLYQYSLNDPVNRLDPLGLDVYLRDVNGRVTRVTTAGGLNQAVTAAVPGSIGNVLFYGGHGVYNPQTGIGGFGQGIDNATDPSSAIVVANGRVLLVEETPSGLLNYGNFPDLIGPKLAPGASINLFGCGTGDPANPNNLQTTLSLALPEIAILGTGGTVVAYENGFHLGLMQTLLNGQITSSGLYLGRINLGH
jgi:hypothetical protein